MTCLLFAGHFPGLAAFLQKPFFFGWAAGICFLLGGGLAAGIFLSSRAGLHAVAAFETGKAHEASETSWSEDLSACMSSGRYLVQTAS